jgi:hypothetical protein
MKYSFKEELEPNKEFVGEEIERKVLRRNQTGNENSGLNLRTKREDGIIPQNSFSQFRI